MTDLAKISDPSPDQRRADPRWIRAHQRLLDVGYELLAQTGVAGIAIDLLISRAKVSKQTFYNHFRDREELTQELWLGARNRLRSEVQMANANIDNPLHRLTRGLAVHARFALLQPSRARFLALTDVDSQFMEAANQGLLRDLSQSSAQGLLHIEDLDCAANFVVAVNAALTLRLIASEVADAAIIFGQMVKMLFRGLECQGDVTGMITLSFDAIMEDPAPPGRHHGT